MLTHLKTTTCCLSTSIPSVELSLAISSDSRVPARRVVPDPTRSDPNQIQKRISPRPRSPNQSVKVEFRRTGCYWSVAPDRRRPKRPSEDSTPTPVGGGRHELVVNQSFLPESGWRRSSMSVACSRPTSRKVRYQGCCETKEVGVEGERSAAVGMGSEGRKRTYLDLKLAEPLFG